MRRRNVSRRWNFLHRQRLVLGGRNSIVKRVVEVKTMDVAEEKKEETEEEEKKEDKKEEKKEENEPETFVVSNPSRITRAQRPCDVQLK